MVIIAYNYNGKVIGIVNAKSQELAIAYWQGKDIYPHNTRNLDDPKEFTPIDESPTGVYPILQTEEIDGYTARSISYDAKLICVK